AELQTGTLFLSYAALGGPLQVFAATRERVTGRPTGLVASRAALLVRGVAAECRGRFPTDALDTLARHLLDPVADLLAEADTVIIAVPPELQGVPFHAMERLADTHH